MLALARWTISDLTIICVSYTQNTWKYAHIVHSRPTLKDVECFQNRSVHEPYERSLYEQTFMNAPFIKKHAISTEVSNVSRENHRWKSNRLCRCDCEPSRIPIRSLIRLRNKGRKVRKFVYARILSCIPMSSTLYCYVNAKKLWNKRTSKFNCRVIICQSIRKVKYCARRYLTLFSCNKLICSCKSVAHIANYCNSKLSRDRKKSWSSNILTPTKQ